MGIITIVPQMLIYWISGITWAIKIVARRLTSEPIYTGVDQ